MLEKEDGRSYRYLTLLVMIYLTADLICLALTYKFVQVGTIKTSIEIFLFPLTYTITDIIAEVYGYNEAKKAIWMVFICDFLFAFFTYLGVHVHSPNSFQQTAYASVFGLLLRGSAAEILGVLSGIFINIYLISKLKILAKGRYFWLRSITSSTLGEAVLLIISMPILFVGQVSASDLLMIIISTYIYKIVFAVVMALPANLLVNILKQKEEIDVFDYNTKFSPFIIEG